MVLLGVLLYLELVLWLHAQVHVDSEKSLSYLVLFVILVLAQHLLLQALSFAFSVLVCLQMVFESLLYDCLREELST